MKPDLRDSNFPKLSASPNKVNAGTVTGPGLSGHAVTVRGKNAKRWEGRVTGPGGAANVWKAEVSRTPHAADAKAPERGIEDISVTVTNPATAEVSDPVARQTDVVP